MEQSLLTVIKDIFLALGLDNPAHAGGWILAVIILVFTVWRLNVSDRKHDEYMRDLNITLQKQENSCRDSIEDQEEKWRALVSKTDEITFEMLKTTTNTMTMLTEKINTLQLILLQMGVTNMSKRNEEDISK